MKTKTKAVARSLADMLEVVISEGIADLRYVLEPSDTKLRAVASKFEAQMEVFIRELRKK